MNFCIGAPLVGRKWHVRLTNSFFPRKHVVWFCNLHHLNFDHLKLNRSFIDCMLGRKSTNGTFASFSANCFQNRCYCNLKTQRRKIIETMISFDNAVHFRTKTEEVMTLQWCAQENIFMNNGFFSCDYFCVYSSTKGIAICEHNFLRFLMICWDGWLQRSY